jgi:hypothetical protein
LAAMEKGEKFDTPLPTPVITHCSCNLCGG